MKKKKKENVCNKTIILILSSATAILTVLCILLATGVISFKSTQINVRTYRYFGYTVDTEPDMYTTLKLYSNGEYEYYINDCSNLMKYNGTYTETDTKIFLYGKITETLSEEVSFNKEENGNILKRNFDDFSCINTVEDLTLDTYVLNYEEK